MNNVPVNDLNHCSVEHCNNETSVLIQKRIGDVKLMFGYCPFHGIVAATFFQYPGRKEIKV